MRNVKAWLVTWEGDHGRENNVALLLPWRTAQARVAELTSLLYANIQGTLSERLLQATIHDDAERPYRARREREGHVLCGENPYLYARRVERLVVGCDENGAERLHWREIDP